MNKLFRDFLFDRNIFVAEDTCPANPFETILSLGNIFNIAIISGHAMANIDMLRLAEERIGIDVPEPFYRGFPESVRELSPEVLLFDQLISYFKTYGMDCFDSAVHSEFECTFNKKVFKEEASIKKFTIVSEEDAREILENCFNDLLSSSRPLSSAQYKVLLEAIREYNIDIKQCASKNTLVKILWDTKNIDFAKLISLNDVIKLADYINFTEHEINNVKKLKLTNKERRFVTKVLDYKFNSKSLKTSVFEECFEKQQLWCGLLHNIHYVPKNAIASSFVKAIRNEKMETTYSRFEKAMKNFKVIDAANILLSEKGEGALIRNLDYILSRTSTKEEVSMIVNQISGNKPLLLLQLYLHYSMYDNDETRTFKFVKNNELFSHTETKEEVLKRKSCLDKYIVDTLLECVKEKIVSAYSNRIEKLYIDEATKNIAVPLSVATMQSGFGILPVGSKIDLPDDKDLWAFTYWEKVDDIDLSCHAINSDGTRTELSWRTMASNQSEAITFSGDITSGFHGGSEYFDINMSKFRETYPDAKYIVFCNNIYSLGYKFNSITCRAGYMLRDKTHSGEVFEPKTVQSSFVIDNNSSFCILFAIDLENNQFIWLNHGMNNDVAIAGETSLDVINKTLKVVQFLNIYNLFSLMATEIVENPEDATVIISDEVESCNENQQLIHSTEFEKFFSYIN